MADTSSYSIEERLVASVWVHDGQHTGQTMSQVMAAFRERFNKAPPRRATRQFMVAYWSVYGDFSATLYKYPVHLNAGSTPVLTVGAVDV
jgi:hypothetical protein